LDNPTDVTTVAIIGGGPGGLMTAYFLERKYRAPVAITIFEAKPQVGGKIVTRTITDQALPYEAGAAELYDYSCAGEDPLRQLIDELGLKTQPMHGRAVFIKDELLQSENDLTRLYGPDTLAEYRAFVKKACDLISPEDYYDSGEEVDNDDPLAAQSFEDYLATIRDPRVRRYIEAAIHSDVAAEPRHTSATYGLHNFLMNEPGYMSLYTIEGGIEKLPQAIAKRLHAEIRTQTRVQSVERLPDGQYLVQSGKPGALVAEEFDAVVVALPNYWIPMIDWRGEALAKIMRDHHAHYDHPAHYLRVTIAFQKPFWRDLVTDSYFMIDALGGCCVYDETSRIPGAALGVLGFLLAGDAAMTMSNMDDRTLVSRVLDSLPAPLRHGRELMIEAKVHRWIGAVNARPGGFPMKDIDARHVLDEKNFPLLFAVGDYLFDSTINGVLDSADVVAEWIFEESVDEVPETIATASTVERLSAAIDLPLTSAPLAAQPS
jgi:protoporphyrinogen oxidase